MANDITVQVRQTGPTTSEGLIRGHTVTVDRPEAKGGNDHGPMGGELLLASLGGCFMSNLLAAIAAREADIAGVSVAITGTLEGAPPRYTAIRMVVTGDYADAEEMQKLVTISERACIVANTLKGAVELTIVVA